MHVWVSHVFDNFFSRGPVHKFDKMVVVHLMEGLVPDLNDTKCDLAGWHTVRAGTKARSSRATIPR